MKSSLFPRSLLKLRQRSLAHVGAEGGGEGGGGSEDGAGSTLTGLDTCSLGHVRVDEGDQRVHNFVEVKSMADLVELVLGGIEGVREAVSHVLEEVADALDEALLGGGIGHGGQDKDSEHELHGVWLK